MGKADKSLALVSKKDIEERFPVLYRAEEIGEVLSDHYPNGLTMKDLLRVKLGSGGATEFTLEGSGGNVVEEVDFVEGIIAYHTPTNILWDGSLDDAEGKRQPLCVSDDGVTGIGNPGGSCLTCPKKQWIDGLPPECDERRCVFLLRDGQWLPIVFSLPLTSGSVFEAFLSDLSTRCISVYGSMVRFTLKKEQNPAGQKYSLLEVTMLGRLAPEELVLSRAYRATMTESLKKVAREEARSHGSKIAGETK
jgi:hypothetical protein